MLTESGVMIGRQAENDDHRPVVPDVCPIIRDEADTGKRTIKRPLNSAPGNGSLKLRSRHICRRLHDGASVR